MKTAIFAFLSAFLMIGCSQSSNGQKNMTQSLADRQEIIETVDRLFIHTDGRNWEKVAALFFDRVLLDYTSMAGGEPAELTPQQIIGAWEAILPGFESTHHQIGNHIVTIQENQAELFCYGTATHYLSNEKGRNVWAVVGSYDFHLKKAENSWKIEKMKFNFKYQDGNTDLPLLAKERAAKR